MSDRAVQSEVPITKEETSTYIHGFSGECDQGGNSWTYGHYFHVFVVNDYKERENNQN